MTHRPVNFLLAICTALSLMTIACEPAPRLELLSHRHTGIDFQNQVIEDDSFNILSHLYLYNGAGVGVGDFDQDGREDVFFAGNMVSSELYLNRGDFRFEAVTQAAGLYTDRWCTGVAVVDINQDQWLDLYVCTAHPHPDSGYANYLFVNQGLNREGVPVFEEEAGAYGLADRGYGTQAAFFDYDRDGDLDMYLLRNAAGASDRNSPVTIDRSGQHRSCDRLFRNEGNGQFSDVSIEAGIVTAGWGLGLRILDVNEDGWPDVYVANDFLSNDLLYLNQQDGTFREAMTEHLAHNSYNSMGIDAADLNHDGHNEIMVLDMLPDDNLRRKTMFGGPNHERFYLNLDRGYHPQLIRNVLQLNYGNGRFGEIGQMAGVAATDWSWAPVMEDIDNDGWRDIVVANGYYRDVTDLDYVEYSEQSTQFGKEITIQQKLREAMQRLEPVVKHNFLYKNTGSLQFEDVSAEWGFTEKTVTHGVAYADFDGDGDLDWVLNNLNQPAMVYENHSQDADERRAYRYLDLQLTGPSGNWQGLGTKIWLYGQDSLGECWQQFHEHSLYRGYKSSVSSLIHFGLGASQQLDSLVVQWPDGTVQRIPAPKADQVLAVSYAPEAQPRSSPSPDPLLTQVTIPGLSDFVHQENAHNDFLAEPLLPHKLSQLGPALAVADVDSDGLDDLWVGGARDQAARLFFQQPDGSFVAENPYPDDDGFEDAGAVWFDADSDGDPDLYVASGGNEVAGADAFYQDRLYRNEGGQLRRWQAALPRIRSSGGAVTAEDFDQDGDLDLFVAGRLAPKAYPMPGRSYLLRNDGGTFTDVTEALAPGLAELGRVTQAIWTDLDQDGWRDLMLVGEWMAPTLFWNREGSMQAAEVAAFEEASGWWNSLVAADIDADGDLDLVAGNLGLNTRYRASEARPLQVFAKDFDNNGSLDPIMSYYLQGDAVPAHYRKTLSMQVKAMMRRFTSYGAYGQATFDEVLRPDEREDAFTLRATCLSSSYFENLGNGDFRRRDLPELAQVAPIYGMLPADLNGDGHLDLLLSGNSYSTETHLGPYDASQGLVLLGDGRGNFESMPARESGLSLLGDSKALVRLRSADGRPLLISSRNQGPLRSYHYAGELLPFIPEASTATLYFADGRRLRYERTYGQGYWSQSGAYLDLPAQADSVQFVQRNGATLTVPR